MGKYRTGDPLETVLRLVSVKLILPFFKVKREPRAKTENCHMRQPAFGN
jgi:hypothetical protein